MVTITTQVDIDLDDIDTDDLIWELKHRGCQGVFELTPQDAHLILKSMPVDVKIGSDVYFAYEKLRAICNHD